jgi:hypothetical protein
MRVPRTIGRSMIILALVLASSVSLPGAWAITSGAVKVQPSSGPPGTVVAVRGRGFSPTCGGTVTVDFTDSAGQQTNLGYATVQSDGSFRLRTAIPPGAAVGTGGIEAREVPIGCTRIGRATFTVTSS